MALRSLDNALPTTPERPKKLAKVTSPIPRPKPSELGVNDENKAPMPATTEPAIDYIASEDLKEITDPETKIKSLMEELESRDWIKVCDALNIVRRFALHHSSFLLPTLDKVMLVMVKSMKNPRSALCKTSIMASSDLFKAFGNNLLASETFDQLLLQLLLKASQDKRFVCEEAEKTLQGMVRFMTPLSLLQKLRAYVSHANFRIRAKASVSISHCVSKMDLEGMKELGLASLIQIAADLLNDRLPEAREAARSTVTSIYMTFIKDDEQKESELSPAESWGSFCASNLTPIQAQSLAKIIP